MLGHFEFAITSEKRINKKEQKKKQKNKWY